MPVPIHFVKVAFKLPDWMEPLSRIYPLVRDESIVIVYSHANAPGNEDRGDG